MINQYFTGSPLICSLGFHHIPKHKYVLLVQISRNNLYHKYFLCKVPYVPMPLKGGFVIFSQWLLIGYFRLYQIRWLPRIAKQLSPQCSSPLQRLEIGEKLLWKYEETPKKGLYPIFLVKKKINKYLRYLKLHCQIMI